MAYILNGFTQVGFDPTKVRLCSQGQNLKSIIENSEVATNYNFSKLYLWQFITVWTGNTLVVCCKLSLSSDVLG